MRRRRGKLAVADRDAEDRSFPPPGAAGAFHPGFARDALARHAERAGFVDVRFVTAGEVDRDGRRDLVFLRVAKRPA
ncbi:MAG: hypothetical protein R2939_08230 [Kofleriaceae bacterium]